MAGLGNVTATPFSVNPPQGEVSIPKGIDMVWVSIADKKIYRANIKFSPKIQNKTSKKPLGKDFIATGEKVIWTLTSLM